MEIRPTFVQGHFIKAQLLEALGRYAEAISSVKVFVSNRIILSRDKT